MAALASVQRSQRTPEWTIDDLGFSSLWVSQSPADFAVRGVQPHPLLCWSHCQSEPFPPWLAHCVPGGVGVFDDAP